LLRKVRRWPLHLSTVPCDHRADTLRSSVGCLAWFALDVFVAHEDIEPSREWNEEIDLALDTPLGPPRTRSHHFARTAVRSPGTRRKASKPSWSILCRGGGYLLPKTAPRNSRELGAAGCATLHVQGSDQVRWHARYQHCETCSMTQQPKRPITNVSPSHSHDSSWPATVDWLDLRNHLVKRHGVFPDDVDNLESYVDGTTGRRRHAEDRHRALHLAPQPSSSG